MAVPCVSLIMRFNNMVTSHCLLCVILLLFILYHSTLQDHLDGEFPEENGISFRHTSGRQHKDFQDYSLLEEFLNDFNMSLCPSGFYKFSENNHRYCYSVSNASSWNYPCFKSGGASVISDLDKEEVNYLLQSLTQKNISRYYWLPAHRKKLFNPVVWYIPGPNWGKRLDEIAELKIQTNIFKNCLLLDIERRTLLTESCSKEYPSLCLYLKSNYFPANCPSKYLSFRFLSDDTCFGIEHEAAGFDSFLEDKCKKPMGDSQHDIDLSKFVFRKLAKLNRINSNTWCWFQSCNLNDTCSVDQYEQLYGINNNNHTHLDLLKGAINEKGNISLFNKNDNLTCMACEKDIIYYQDTDIKLEYSMENMKLFLTVYFPSGLRKYNYDDNGFQCFSDANGFISVIDINDIPLISVENMSLSQEPTIRTVDKIVYIIDLITERSAQYWCEAHTKNYSLISTNKILANPTGDRTHVFALMVNITIDPELEDLNITNIIPNISSIFQAEIAILMDIIYYVGEHAILVYHLHVPLNEINETESEILPIMLKNLQKIAEIELPKYNVTFINISSSIYCFPDTSKDSEGFEYLDWELTLIGHIAAPKQFCLKHNGLPVKRLCEGSYLLGGYWGSVDGYCDKTYKASETTSFLYNFFKGHVPGNFTTRFLIDGLSFVLGNLEIIIPADIYYLSMSLQHVINVASQNDTPVDLGDVDNIAWVMDRVMDMDHEYLRLSQTLNSTNVILDSITDIIDMISKKTARCDAHLQNYAHQVSIKPQFIVQISYPSINNISGIAILKGHNYKNKNYFENVTIRPLFRNTTLKDVLSLENLEVAAWVPDNVLKTLKQSSNSSDVDEDEMHIIINVFYDDSVFQQLDNAKHKINSRIIGITIPGFISNLEYPIPILFKELKEFQTLKKICGFWDFNVLDSSKNPGFWSKQGCFYVLSYNNITVCECYHMTHFGELFDIGGIMYPSEKIDKIHVKALNIITLIGSMLSLLGVTGIWVTALVFQVWRKKASTKILLQLSTSIALPLILLLVFCLDDSMFVLNNEGKYEFNEDSESICIILGAFLHYSILSSFMWMLITAVLQFIRYVRVLGVCRPSRFMIKFTILGWGIPLIPVIGVLSVNSHNYIPDDKSSCICYPNGNYFIISVLIPVLIIVVTNVILFVLVIISISRKSDKSMRATDIDLVGAQLRLSIFLFFLLGLTWLFAIFSFSSNLLWSYLFCLTSTLQGFIIFIYFIILDPATRHLWVTLMKPQFSTSRDSISSISSS